MRTASFLTAAAALTGSALAQNPVNITALSANLPVGPPYGYTGQTSLSVTVSHTTGTTTCSTSWPGTPAPFTTWAACADPSVQWRVPTPGWTGGASFEVDLYVSNADGGLTGSHTLDMNPGDSSDPNAYLSCIQYGKFTPLVCNLGGPLAAQQPPVEFSVTQVSALPARRSLSDRVAKAFAA
jgi:hypothetical protein